MMKDAVDNYLAQQYQHQDPKAHFV
jgi:hypothetical protein